LDPSPPPVVVARQDSLQMPPDVHFRLCSWGGAWLGSLAWAVAIAVAAGTGRPCRADVHAHADELLHARVATATPGPAAAARRTLNYIYPYRAGFTGMAIQTQYLVVF
jgi:hypothetical protein